MDITQLQTLVSVTNQRLDLKIDDLASNAISQVFLPYCADGMIHVRDVTAYLPTATDLTVQGTGDAFPFLNMPVTTVFSLSQDQQTNLLLTATVPTGWSFSQAFPALQRSVFDALTFTPSPTWILSSTPLPEENASSQETEPTSAQSTAPPSPTGTTVSSEASQQTTEATEPLVPTLTFSGTLSTQSPLAAFSLLQGATPPTMGGRMTLFNGIPDIFLLGEVDTPIKLDFIEITDIAYGLYSDPKYNFAYDLWEADAYLIFTANILFHAQNQDYVIPITAEIYNPAQNIVFSADITDGIDAVLDELSALTNGQSLSLPDGWSEIKNHISLTELTVALNPSGAQKISYLAMTLETVEEWTLIPDLLELQAIDVSFRVDSPFSSPQVSGSVSGLIGIGEAGTLELTAFFETFAFGGELREGDDPLSLSEVFEHFLGITDDQLPDINLEAFSFYVEPSTEIYNGSIELDGEWIVPLDETQALVFEGVSLQLDHPGQGQPTTFDAQGWFSIAGVSVTIQARYGGPAEGWTFQGETGSGQAIPIGALISDLANSFGAITLPSAIADLTIENLAITFNTLTRHFTFTCTASTLLGSTSMDLSVTLDLLPGTSGYTKQFGGTVTVGTRQFTLFFSEDATSTLFLAEYANPGGDKIKLKEDLVAPLSADIAQYIPAALEIDFKDVLFVFDKSTSGTQPTFLFGLDLGVTFPSLANLPLVGQELSPEQDIKINNLRVLFTSQALTADLVGTINNLLTSGIAPLPAIGLSEGLTLSATIIFGNTPQIMTVPIAGVGTPPTPTPVPVVPGTTSTNNATWFALQKSFGPLYFNRVGVQYQDAAVWFLLDAALSLAGLTLSLDGLAVGSPLTPFAPEFQLRGLGLAYQSGPIEIDGSFLHSKQTLPDGTSYDEYDGAALIRTEELTISALGSYALLGNNPSLFIYAVLDYPLGGPSFFFVTGLAAGFGYNRSLTVPALDQIAQFPLVAEAVSGATPPQSINDIGNELAKLEQYIHPEVGETFFAVGIRFTSFKIIDSFVLVTVAFGNELEVNVLGLSTLILPTPIPDEPPVTPVAVVQMAVKASYIPAQGFLGVSAQLTSASYLFSNNCHLTGGFAFYSWFAGEHNGDFVQTLGGYHPSFVVPAHYPTVPRLGYSWQVDSQLSIKGQAYCALTASALMAGMQIQANWDSGDLKAWFSASFDFLISWKPFHYDISAHVNLGASYTFWFFGTQTVSFDVGADLHIWGPEFSGTAHINLSIISFDISFGANSGQSPTPIDWATFKKSFLPADADVVGISVKTGLLNKTGQDNTDLGVVDPKTFALVTNSVVPSTSSQIATGQTITTASVTGNGVQSCAASGKPAQALSGATVQSFGQIAIGPMGVQVSELVSMQTITITHNGKHVEDQFVYTPVLKSVPVGMWGHTLQPDLNGPRFVDNACAGFEITPAAPAVPGETTVLDRQALRYEPETIPAAYVWSNNLLAFESEQLDDVSGRQKLNATLTAPAVTTARQHVLAALGIDTLGIEFNATQASTLANDYVSAPQIEKV